MEEVSRLLKSLPSSKIENEISTVLRSASPEDRDMAIFSILSAADSGVRLAGLRIAKRVHDPAVAGKIVALGLERGDVYEVRFWLESASATIGVNKTLSLVAEYSFNNPGKVIRSWPEIQALADRGTKNEENIRKIISIIDDLVISLPDVESIYWLEIRSAKYSKH